MVRVEASMDCQKFGKVLPMTSGRQSHLWEVGASATARQDHRELARGSWRVTTQNPARALKRARARAEQAERDARRIRDQRRRWEAEGARLTRAEFKAGVLCRGCREPWLDGLGGWPPLLQITLEQLADHDCEEERYRARNDDCRAHRETVEGRAQGETSRRAGAHGAQTAVQGCATATTAGGRGEDQRTARPASPDRRSCWDSSPECRQSAPVPAGR